MKKILVLIFMVSNLFNATGQNLVPNGDFEAYGTCPDDISQLDTATGWITPTDGTSDYFNQCTTNPLIDVPGNFLGYQAAHSGVGYAGIFFYDIFMGITLNYREYLEVPLTNTLVNGTCYRFQMYLSLADNSAYSVSNIEVHFSDTLVHDIITQDTLALNPQIVNASGQITDTANWVLFTGNYTAHGGENYLIIGNFKGDSSVDTLLFNPNFPLENMAYYYIDDVSLTPCSVTVVNDEITNQSKSSYPNPFHDELTFITGNEHSEVSLFDITSRKILHKEFANSTRLATEQLAKGIYLYELRSSNGVVKKGKVIKE